MVGPARRREAVEHLEESFPVSERRACCVINQPRSTQRYKTKHPKKDKALIAQIHHLANANPRAGYRTITKLLVREGWRVNQKRVHRLWKKEGLKVPCRPARKRARGKRENSTQKLATLRKNHVWSYDFIFDQTDDGSRLKWLPILDEFTRELLSLRVERSITARNVIEQLEKHVKSRGAPEFIRSDNGSEFIAKELKKWIAEKGFKTTFIEPGSPWQNAYCESFNSRFRDEFLNIELFTSLLEAKMLGEEHRYLYNHQRPHSSLGDLTPAEFASRCESPLI